MSSGQIVTQVRNIAEELASELGLEVVDVEYVKERGSYFLRIFLDKESGIGLEELEEFARQVSPSIDEVITGSYYLETASPGLDRPLKKDQDYERFSGSLVQLKLFAAIDNRKKFTGTLVGLFEGVVTLIDNEGREWQIPKENIAKANLYVEF